MMVTESAAEIAAQNPTVRVVKSFHDLVTTSFTGRVNALCWERPLAGDFAEVASSVAGPEEITSLTDETLRKLDLSAAGRRAANFLLEDLRLLRSLGLDPALECIRNYPRDDPAEPVPTDVYSFHADSATIPTDTYLCSYTEAASEGIRNFETHRSADVAETRAALLKLFGGEDDEAFAAFLHEYNYDLHYAANPGARPFSFGLGNLWRIAVEFPGCPVPPCIHRAPATIPGRPPRLLLIS